jgi:hypothetical protein
VVNPFRFQDAHDRLAAARVAVARLSVMVSGGSQFVLAHTMGDLDDAARLFEETNLAFIKLENLLTIIEWQIERLSAPR